MRLMRQQHGAFTRTAVNRGAQTFNFHHTKLESSQALQDQLSQSDSYRSRVFMVHRWKFSERSDENVNRIRVGVLNASLCYTTQQRLQYPCLLFYRHQHFQFKYVWFQRVFRTNSFVCWVILSMHEGRIRINRLFKIWSIILSDHPVQSRSFYSSMHLQPLDNRI